MDNLNEEMISPKMSQIMLGAPFKYKPEHEIYFIALEEVWEDGIVTDDEKRMLETLQSSLDISEPEHNFLESKIEKVQPERYLDAYKKALEQAWADGILTADEQEFLAQLRKDFKISEQEHDMLEKEIRSTMAPSHKSSSVIGLDNADYWLQQGEELWSSSDGNLEDALKAITYFEKAIELDPHNFYALVDKGVILKKLNRREESLECYNQAIEIEPEYPNSWFNKGVLLGCMGQLQDAVKCFDKVIELVPNHNLAIKDRELLINFMNRRKCSRIKKRTLKIS